VLEAERSDAEVYFISCANISVFSVIAELERRLGQPVVTSNQAVVWDCARELDAPLGPVEEGDGGGRGLGRLLACRRAGASALPL
jgi:maleate cis-trans isomerase